MAVKFEYQKEQEKTKLVIGSASKEFFSPSVMSMHSAQDSSCVGMTKRGKFEIEHSKFEIPISLASCFLALALAMTVKFEYQKEQEKTKLVMGSASKEFFSPSVMSMHSAKDSSYVGMTKRGKFEIEHSKFEIPISLVS